MQLCLLLLSMGIMMNRILVISGHSNLDQSTGNATILADLQEQLGNRVSIRKLDKLYPHYAPFDVAAEQQALLAADTIVLQFPMNWYSVPALLKKWIDEVFLFGFAYGDGGDKLKGKKLLLSFTTGAGAQAYDGNQCHRIAQFMPPFIDTARLCGLDWQEPVYTHGVLYIPGVHDEVHRQEILKLAHDHAKRLIARLD